MRNCASCLQVILYPGIWHSNTATSKSKHEKLLFLFWASELEDGIVPSKMWLSNCRQATKKDYLGDNLHPRCRYAFRVPVAASNSPRYGGEGFIGLEENSGWNWTPTKYGWSTRQTSKKITQCRKKIVEKFLGKNLIEDFRLVSRSQSSTCEFKGEAAKNFFPQKATDNRGRRLVGQTKEKSPYDS